MQNHNETKSGYDALLRNHNGLFRQHGIQREMLQALLEHEKKKSSSQRRHNIKSDLREILEKYVDVEGEKL